MQPIASTRLNARHVLVEVARAVGPVMLLAALGALLVLSQSQLRESQLAVDEARAGVAECRVAVERERARVDLFRELLGVAAKRGQSAVGGR